MTAQNATNPPVAKKELSSAMRFFSNPIVGLVGTVASIIGVLLAVFFYVQTAKFRELVYYVNPAQAVVVKTGESSRLRVLIGERELKTDVTTAQIAIWNRGTESLKSSDVLSPLMIRTNPPVPILEATVRKKSREVVDISLDQKHLEDGALGLSLNILEEGDGGIIQIVYAGNPDNTKITLSGVIEGKRRIRQLLYSGEIKSAADQIRKTSSAFDVWIPAVMGVLVTIGSLYAWHKSSSFKEIWWLLLLGLAWLGASIYGFLSSAPSPPFGF